MDTSIALLQATLDVLNLQALSWQLMYGYGVSYELTELGHGQLTTEAATWRRYVGAVLDASSPEPA